MTIEYNEAKFGELMLYIADRMAEETYFGATVLNKALFFSDFFHYAQHGTAITGAEYQKLDHGPAPKRLLPVQRDLVAHGDAAIRQAQIGGFSQKRLVPLRDADMSHFSGTEVAMVEEVLTQLSGRHAKAISDASHRMVGWRAAKVKQTIPYTTVFLISGPVTDADIMFAKEAAHELGEQLASAS